MDKSFGFDEAVAARWLGYVRAALWPYFRPQVIGAENLPAGRALIVGCHSGVLPYDAACTLIAVHEATGRCARSIGDRLFARFAPVENFLRQQGACVGRPPVVEALLRAGNLVLLFPSDARDMERPYLTQRYTVLPHRGFARGHGCSEPVGRRRPAWTFDDLVFHDVPTAVAHVRSRTRRKPFWVGHSMGGMLMYAALGHVPAVAGSTAGPVTIASPAAFPAVASGPVRVLGRLFTYLPVSARLPQHGALVALWWAIGWSPGAERVGMNPRNVDRHAFGKALRRFLCNPPATMVRQLADWSLSGEFRSIDGEVDYRAGLERIVTPARIIAGAADVLASPATVRFAYDHLGSERKRCRQFAQRNGDIADYGHVDLLFGWRAPEEVFPVIADWIRERAAEVAS